MAKQSKGTVGVVGLGNMGGAFARHLAAAGWRVLGFDIDAARKRAAARAGVEIAPVETLAAVAPVIILSLPNPQALDATVAAITQHELPGRIVVEASTFTLEDKQRAETQLRKAGHVMLDCPVSGTGAQAAVKDIVIYASGDAKAIAKTARMFSDFSRATFNVGDFGNGSRMKYVANLLVTIHNVASAEAMVLGIKSGLDPQLGYDLIRTGPGTSPAFELRGPDGRVRPNPLGPLPTSTQTTAWALRSTSCPWARTRRAAPVARHISRAVDFATACISTGTFRSPWMTGWCCERMSTGPLRSANFL